VVVDGTHNAGGVAAAEWLAATLGGGDVKAGGPGAHTSAVDDGLCTGSEGRGNSASPSSYLLSVHEMMMTSPLFSPFRMPLQAMGRERESEKNREGLRWNVWGGTDLCVCFEMDLT